MKRLITLMLGTIVMASLVACGNGSDKSQADAAQSPSPYTEYNSIAEAADAAGFSLTVPDKPNGFAKRTIQTINGGDSSATIEVVYSNDNNSATFTQNEICIRKSVGNEDISGDYTTYSQNTTTMIDGAQVTAKGDDGKIRLATWTKGKYTYSIGFYYDSGISSDELSGYITSIR